MRIHWLACLLLGGAAWGQMTQPAPTPQSPTALKADTTPKTAPTVNAGDAVITVKTACDDPARKGAACETVITRDQFEKLADALQPNMSPAIKIRLANAYAKMAAMTKEAEKRGLDKQPKFEQSMRFARMQILSQQLTASLQEESNKVSDSEIEKYYKEKAENYQEATLLRLFVPRTKQIVTPKPDPAKKNPAAEKEDSEAQQKAGEAAMKKTADDLHARAVKGEDFDRLEKEAYAAAGLKGSAPSTKMDKVRLMSLSPAHKSAFTLKPGEVSSTISDSSGYYVYKLVSKQALPLESVKLEIKNLIGLQRFRDVMQEVQGTAELNESYFGEQPKPKAPPQKPGSEPEKEMVDPD